MECLSDKKLHAYVEKSLPAVECSRIRDHLIVCESCRERHRRILLLESCLLEPVYQEPPAVIEEQVMRRIYARIPSLSSVLVLIGASFLFLVSWIYVYFDFANNSFIQALRLTTANTSSWIGSVVKVISTVFTAVYGGFKALNKFFAIVFDVNVGVEIFALTLLMFSLLLFYGIYQWLFKRSKKQKI